MHPPSAQPPYGATLIPALQRIQEEYGYLNRAAMEQCAEQLGLPAYRLQAVASFFPHFQLQPPKKVTLRICRDLSCHLAGAGAMLRELAALNGTDVVVEGVSCLGRCDRAPAACVSAQGGGHDRYYLARNAAELREIVKASVSGEAPAPDHDATLPYPRADWKIDTYGGAISDYAAVRKVIATRDVALNTAAETLARKPGWGTERLGEFRLGVLRQHRPEFKISAEAAEAVRAWQQDEGWAAGPTMAGWSEGPLLELQGGDLRGLGGAGIPAIQKWRDVRDAVRTARAREADDRAFIVVNGDESEPGTFKDRELLLRLPHLIVEAVILAGLLSDASQGFIYIRHEYEEQIEACRAEIRRAEALGVCGLNAPVLGRPFPISVFVSPGGYICGEQSALIEAMSDRRGEPRPMPPKLETNGLEDLPTLVSNVETFGWAPFIILRGGAAYAAEGMNSWKGRRFFSISGDVKRPGVYEVPMGMKLRDLVYGEEYCGGIAGDREFKGFAPSGPSGGFLPAVLRVGAGLPRNHTENKQWQAFCLRHGLDPAAQELSILELELELNLFRALSPTGALGAGVVVYAEGRNMAEQAVNSLEFYRNESCGKCVPCRLGSQKMVSLGNHLLSGTVQPERWEKELMPLAREMGAAIGQASICGLGRSVPVPLATAADYFPEDIAHYLAKPSNPISKNGRRS